MKHSRNDTTFHQNLLQALQKNKVIQGKSTESQRSRYVQLLRDMQSYNLKEKYNRELLYTWKKESYVRQMIKHLQDYLQQCHGVRDAYYEYQLQKLGSIIDGQQTLVIPPIEEERRLNVNAKYRQFLRKNPLQTSLSMRGAKSASISTEQSNDVDDVKEEVDTPGLEETWTHIHAQSAVGSRRKQNNILPNIHRSATRNEIRRNKSSTKRRISPKAPVVSQVLVKKSPEIVPSPSEEKLQRSLGSPIKSSSTALGLSDGVEPLIIASEILDKHARADLLAMRSVRRARKNPSEVNLLFETRRRIYQINKRTLDLQLYQRKCQLQQNLQFDRFEPVDSINHIENLSENVDKNIPKQNDDKQQSDQSII